jgi:hypothetical protein
MVMLKIVSIHTTSWSCFLRFIFGIYLLTDNSGVPLFPVDKWDICHDQINLISEQLDTFWIRDTLMIEHQHEMSEKHDQYVAQDDTITKEQHFDDKYSITSAQMTEDGIGNTNLVQSSPFTGLVTKVTRRVSHVE